MGGWWVAEGGAVSGAVLLGSRQRQPRQRDRPETLRKVIRATRLDGRATMAATSPSAADLRRTVLDMLASLKPPVHVAALSMQYKQRTGRAMKGDYQGGMLKFLKAECADAVVLAGEGNDTFVRVATPTSVAVAWVRECVSRNGPILASMVGRLYHEAHGQLFSAAFPEGFGTGIKMAASAAYPTPQANRQTTSNT